MMFCLDFAGVALTIRASFAGIAQLVEHDLAKVGAASSSLVSRSRFKQLVTPGAASIRAFSFGRARSVAAQLRPGGAQVAERRNQRERRGEHGEQEADAED